jgi:hypothetical protein
MAIQVLESVAVHKAVVLRLVESCSSSRARLAVLNILAAITITLDFNPISSEPLRKLERSGLLLISRMVYVPPISSALRSPSIHRFDSRQPRGENLRCGRPIIWILLEAGHD